MPDLFHLAQCLQGSFILQQVSEFPSFLRLNNVTLFILHFVYPFICRWTLWNIYLFIWLCWILVVARGIFIVACGIFSCSICDLVPWPGIKPRPPALVAWNLSHWTLGLLTILAVVNNTAMNMGVQISLFKTLLSLLLCIYPEVELLDHMVILFKFFCCFP